MAKKLKYPKKPKASAPLSSWENYDKKVKEVDKKNSAMVAEKKKKEKLIQKHR